MLSIHQAPTTRESPRLTSTNCSCWNHLCLAAKLIAWQLQQTIQYCFQWFDPSAHLTSDPPAGPADVISAWQQTRFASLLAVNSIQGARKLRQSSNIAKITLHHVNTFPSSPPPLPSPLCHPMPFTCTGEPAHPLKLYSHASSAVASGHRVWTCNMTPQRTPLQNMITLDYGWPESDEKCSEICD